MEERSIHDNNVYAHKVYEDPDRTHRCIIVLHTEFNYKELVEFTDIVFSGVRAYHFQNVQEGNILFDIVQGTMEDCYEIHEALFEALQDQVWPVPYRTPEELFEIAAQSIETVYFINSSYGLHGFVWAETMALVEREARATL